MTVLIPYGDAVSGQPSHRCDDCGKDLYVWPTPWQLAWPKSGGGDLCSSCHATTKGDTSNE